MGTCAALVPPTTSSSNAVCKVHQRPIASCARGGRASASAREGSREQPPRRAPASSSGAGPAAVQKTSCIYHIAHGCAQLPPSAHQGPPRPRGVPKKTTMRGTMRGSHEARDARSLAAAAARQRQAPHYWRTAAPSQIQGRTLGGKLLTGPPTGLQAPDASLATLFTLSGSSQQQKYTKTHERAAGEGTHPLARAPWAATPWSTREGRVPRPARRCLGSR